MTLHVAISYGSFEESGGPMHVRIRFNTSTVGSGKIPSPNARSQCCASSDDTSNMARLQDVSKMAAWRASDPVVAHTNARFVNTPSAKMECRSLRQLNA